MGKLTAIKTRRTTVNVDAEQSFDVRGISTNDLMALLADHGSMLAMVFGKITSGRISDLSEEAAGITGDDVRDIIFKLAKEFPDIASAVIALAGDDYNDDGMASARDLPFLVQITAMEAIFHLTFSSEADVKKLVESLTKAMTVVSGALTTSPVQPSRTGIGG